MTDGTLLQREQVAIDLFRPTIAAGQGSGSIQQRKRQFVFHVLAPTVIKTVVGRPVGHFPVLQPPHFRPHLAVGQHSASDIPAA